MDIVCYEHDQGFVLRRFQTGEFDYIDAASEVVEGNFFKFIKGKGYLEALSKSYPSPRKKEEVPTWFYLASNLSMRLHGVQSYSNYSYVVRCGGMLNEFGPDLGRKKHVEQTGDVTLRCEGFNHKNHYERQTPCDQDYLRKFSRDTKPDELHRWFNQDVVKVFKQHKVFDPEGIFIGDASYIFVPDNENYEGSIKLLFDEHNHPVGSTQMAKLSAKEATRLKWRRCYKLVSLLHTNRQRSFSLRIAMRVVSGESNECPLLYQMIDEFVAAIGEGVIKRLIVDRGFLDGKNISRCKLDYGIDVLVPVKKSMDIYHDVLGLLRLDDVEFRAFVPSPREPIDAPRLPDAPESIRKRELKRQKTIKRKKAQEDPPPANETLSHTEVGALSELRSWSSCRVPLNVIVNRDTYADGHQEIWMLLDTRAFSGSQSISERRDEYQIRTEIEEGHRQLKCFWDLTQFTSRSFSLILNQIAFVLLAFNLLQIYLHQRPRRKLTRRSLPRILNELLPTASVIIIYCDNRFALLTPLEYTELLLTLGNDARLKILRKTRQLRRDLVTTSLPQKRL